MKKNVIDNKKYYFSNIIPLIFGCVILFVFVLFSIFPSFFSTYSQKEMFEPWAKMSIKHFFGTNDLGYDIYSEFVFATRPTLTIALLSATISLIIGIVFGMLSSCLNNYIGSAINGFINFFMLIPILPVVIVVAAYFEAKSINLIIIISVFGWSKTAKYVRAKTKQLINMPFVKSLSALGYSKARIIFLHILPNLKDVLIARCITQITSAIMLEATLSFLGIGEVYNVTWGLMINNAFKLGAIPLEAYAWIFAPGVGIMLISLSFYFIGTYFENRVKQTTKEIKSEYEQ